MEANIRPTKIKTALRKGGYEGNRIWKTHRLEGVVKNKGIKSIRKKKNVMT